jgi:uncharacterized protein YbjT (DUF2867 family)
MSPSVVPIGVTGATGQLGGRVARRLAAAGVAQRLLVRDPDRAPQLPGADVVRAPFGDGDAVRKALAGLDTVLMVSASETVDRVDQHRTFIDAAAAAGVGHLVYISFAGAAPDATFTLARDHWATEQHIRASGIPFTFLRDNLYADFLPQMVGADGVIRGPAGDPAGAGPTNGDPTNGDPAGAGPTDAGPAAAGAGRAAVVAQDDIADAVVAVLRDPGAHAGRAYELTGPEALTLAEVAAVITTVTGHPVSYRQETIEEAYASRATYGAPSWQLDAWVSTYTAIADGSLATVTTAISELTGHPATPLEQVLRTRGD